MASGGAEEGDGGIPLDIDNVHMLLQVEHDQIQKRTFTNWINAQLAKGCPPSFVSDLFSDLRDGSKLLDLLEVMSGQMMKRQKGHGVFQQRANIETALKFLKKKNVKLVNINIPDIIDGRPSIILGLVWTIILHCHIEELASALSFSSRHSSLDSLSSLDSWSGSPVPASPGPAGRSSPLHRRFRMSAKKVLLMWVRDQCKKVHCSVNVKDFKSSWKSGEVFLAILCSLRPQLVDLSLVQFRSNQENLEEAFHLAEQELHIPRLLEPQDVDVSDPDEKSIMMYVAQFLQFSSDMPAPDDHLQVSPCERAQYVTCWLQQADQELSDSWKTAENSSYAEKYQVLQSFVGSFTEQRRAVMTLLAALRRHPELNQQQCALKTAWDHLEEELQRCKSDLDLSLPPPLDSVAAWLKHVEAGLAEDAGSVKDHADAAKEARAQQDVLKILNKEMSYYVKIVETYHNMDDSGNVVVPPEKFDEIRKRLTNIRVSAKYRGIRLEYQESRHTVLDLLSQISAKVQSWKAPCRSQESMHVLLQDWHETTEHQDLLFLLTNALQTLKEKANVYTSKAALSENFQLVNRQVKEAEREVETVRQAVTAARGTMERVVSAWEMYSKSLTSLQAWLAQEKHFQAQSPAAAQDISEWASCQAQLNEAGNFLIEVTERSTSLSLAEQLSKVNMQWAEYVKKAMFEVSSEPCAGASCLQMVHSITQEASLLLRQPLEVASVPLKAIRQKLQLLSKKTAEVNVSSLSSSPDFQTSHLEKLQKTIPQMLVEAEGACRELQQAASRLEGGLAELDRWSTDALDSYHQKEKSHRGHSTLGPTAKGLISRGLQLANQVKTEEMDLQSLVARLQKTSPLQHLSTSSLKDRITEAVSHCQEILGMFSSLGWKQEAGEFPENQPPFETIFQTHKQSEMGLLVVARTKHVDNTGNIMLQSQHMGQLSAHNPQQRTRDLQGKVHGEKDIITSNIVTNSSSVTLLVPTAKEAESEFLIQPQSFSKLPALASGFIQNDPRPPATTQTPVRIKCSEISVLSKHGASSLLQFQTKTAGPSSVQSSKPPQPPVMVHSEVHSRAQSMARSRLEKARFRLQGCIQQVMKLFCGKEISESEAKKKQKALKILQPATLEEFLCAVEGFGAFCSGPQLQDLMLLSDSVRKQWEDVCREMAAFIPILWSEIREGKQSFSVVRCEMHTNAFSEATAQTACDSLQQQAVTEGAASIEERAESLRELCETLTPKKSSCLATDQLSESDEVEETQPSDTAIPADRGGQPGGDTPLSATDVSADTQPSNNLLQKQSGHGPHEDRSSVCYAVPVQPHGDILKPRVQDVPPDKKTDSGSEQNPKPSLRAKEQLLKARLLHIAESSQQTQTHTQAVVRSNTVETKQEAEWTIIPESAAGAQGEHPSEQEVQESYSKFCSAFKSQLQKNELLLETFIPDPVSILDLENQKKHLQILIQETEALWFDVELQYAWFSQFSQLMTKEEGWSEVEREQGQLTQQWREQQVCLQIRMASLENIADLMKSADDQKTLITQKLNKIIGESVDISSLTLAGSTLLPDLKEMDSRLQAGMRKLSENGIKEERQGPEATSSPSFSRGLHNSFHHFEQLRQQLEKLQSAVWALDCFLATVREVKTEIQTVLASQHLSRQKQEADWEQDRHSLRAVMQRLQAATVQSDSVDSSLKAVGMTLTMDSAPVTCQDVVKSVAEHVVEIEKQISKDVILLEKLNIQEHEELKTMAIWQTKSGNASLQQQEVQEDPTASEADEESGLEPKRCKLGGENETKTQKEEEHTTQTWRLGEDVPETKDQRQRRRSSLVKKQGEKKESFVQRRAALLATLMETKKEAEQLNLQEPTLPALQQRIRALTELESRLADLLSEVQYILGASSQSGTPDQSQTSEVEDLWEETSKAVTERLEQCGVLTELLKRFQSIRGELSVTLQRAESTVSEHASYMGKDNLQRLYTKVQETKAALNDLGDGIEEVRSVCRQIHTHLRQIPECTFTPFESEADALMDRWLDLSERTDSCLENVHLALSLWDGVLQLGTEVERWTSDKVAVFAQCPSFRSEDDIKALQNETVIQEEHIQHFHRRATEIQTLLQSTESPLELQVVETQMRKKIEELKELISEAEDVYKQMVITKGQITGRMGECFNSLQKIQDSLLTLSGPDVAAVLGKLKELCRQLQSQDEQAESLLEDVHVMASITGPESPQSLSVEGIQLQEKVRNTHQLFSEVEEQTERNIRDLDRLQTEKEHLEQWLHAAEEKAAKGENLSLLQEEALQQRVRTELLIQLVSSLQSSNLQQLAVLEDSQKLLERYHNFYTNISGDSKETRSSLREDIEVFRALFKSAQSWIRDLRQAVDSALVESPGIHTPLEQKLHCAQAVLNAAFEGEARLEELRVTGDDLCRRALNQDDLKQEVQETLQRAEEQWRGTLQSVEPYYSALKADPEVTSLYLAQRREACCKVEELQHQTDQLPTLFPWPGTAERKQAYRLAHQLQEEIESLQLTLTSMSERRHELTEQTSNSIWKDSSWAELDTRCSALMAELKDACFQLEEGASNEEHFGQLLQHCYHKLTSLQERMSACQAQKEISAGANTDVVALEALLQEVTDVEKDLLQLASLKDSIKASSTAEAQASLTQQVSNLQNHKRALESSIRETLAQLKVNRDGSIQQVIEEASYVQTALKDLAEGVKNLSGISEALPDISQLKQQWCTIQDCGSRLTELAARAEALQRTRESSSTQETLPADIILTVSAMFGELGSLRSIFLQKKQDCAENTANRVRENISQLQEWSQRMQAEPSTHSQETLDEGLQLQQALHKVLSEQDFLFNCLGTNAAQKLEKSASATLTESQSAIESISKHLAIPVHGSVHLENKDLPSRSEQESGVPYPVSNGKTLPVGLTASPFSCAADNQENSDSDQNDNKIKTKGTEPPAETSGGTNVEADAAKQDQAGVVKTKDDILAQIQVACSETPVVLKTQLDPHQLTPQEVLLKSYLGQNDNSVHLYTDSSSQSSILQTLSENDTGPLVSHSHPNLSKNLIAREENTPLQNDITLTSLSKLSAVGADNTEATDSAHCVPSLIELPPTKPDSLPITDPESVSEHLEVQLETFKANTNAQEKHCKDISVTTKKVFTVVLDVDPQDMWRKENAGACSREAPLSNEKHTKFSSTEFPEMKIGIFITSKSQESDKDMQHCSLAAHQSETSTAVTSVREKENFCEDVSVDVELHPVDIEKHENANTSSPDTPRHSQEAEFSTARPTEVSSRVFPENKSGLFTTSISPESDEIDLKTHYESPESSPSVLMNTVWEKVNCVRAKLPCKENHKAHGLKHNEVLKSSKSCFPGAECQLAGAHAAETTFPDVKPKETTDFCDSGEQTVSAAEDSLESGEALNDTHISATGKKQVTPDNTVCSADTACEEVPKGENTEEANDLESTECKGSEVPERRDIALLPKGRSERKLPAALEDMGVTQEQPQIPETALGSAADLGSKEMPAGSGNSCKRRSTMWEILSEIQNVVERSNIINRTSHTDLNWYLRSSPGEPEIQLVRTVQKILACRYQPARLSVTAMAKQLEEAKEYQHAVQEQVATLKNSTAERFCEPSDLKSAEDQWSAALLDASATVQVKAAQLDQVKQYHRQMKITRAFLEVVAAEKGKMSLNSLGSSALQAEKLHVLVQTMEQKKDMMEDLLRLSSQLSVHLSDAESSGALLAQLGDVQEEWRLLKGSLNRALRHASNSTCQSSLFLKEAEQLKAKLEALQKSDCQNLDSKCSLEFVCLTTDLKLYNQICLHLQSQSDALINFSLGQKEKDEIESSLQGMASLLSVTKKKLDSLTFSCGDSSSTKINNQLRDLIVWAKQAENHISIGKKLALFPEEARIQIVEMKKFQTDILSRQSKMRVQVEEMKELASNMENEETDQVLKTVEDLYEAIADSLDLVLDTMKKDLQEREKLLCALASMDACLAEIHAKRDPCTHVDSVSKADLRKLESDLKSHQLATAKIESQLKLVEEMSESCRKIAIGLSPAESRYLVNRLSGLWTELDGLLAHEKATSWELEELIHERTASDRELSTIQASLKQISADLEQLKFPLTQKTLSVIAQWKHMLMEHQCQAQELQHCLEAKRSSLLCCIGELQDSFKELSVNVFEQEKYLKLRTQMEESRDTVKGQIQDAKNKAVSLDERFRLCQTVLVELPLAKTQCQEAADQLEVIAQELDPSVLDSERERIHHTVETLLSWEHRVTDDIKNLEAEFLPGLRFNSELPAFVELLESTRVELEGAKPVSLDEAAIDIALQRYWVIWRNMESGIWVLENLGQKEKIDPRNYKELYSLRDSAMQECHSQMVTLSQARESLKDYHWAAQGAISFLHNAEATFLSAPGGFLDCAEEQKQTKEALEALEEGFQAHICHLVERVPQQPCLSRSNTEQLHVNILSQLLVGRAVLEAQAQLRLESLQRCELTQQSHKKCHEDICQHLSQFEDRLSQCAAEHVTSFDKCVAQQRRAQLFMEDLHSLAGRIDDLRAGCPTQGCGVGKDGEVGAFWRCWVSLRRGVGLLMARTEQRGEEWKDITTSMEKCCSSLASLQTEVRDSATVNFTREEPQELLALAEMRQTGLEQEQQALASLEHRLERALSLSSSQDFITPGPIGKMLVKIQDNVRSLQEQNLLVVAAAQAEENERQQVQEQIGEIQKRVLVILPALEAYLNPNERQELRKELSSQKTKLKCIMDSVQSRYAEAPADIGKQIQELQVSLQRAEEKLIENSLASRVLELGSGMEKVKALLEQRSPTVSEAQNVLKHVWDELDAWHSSLMLLESEVQDLAEEQPDQAQRLIDQLTQPQQLYQDAAQMVEQRTTFLSKIPKCLQELEDILCSATRWLDEAQSWLTAPCSFTTTKSLQNHAKSLQLVLDDSEMIRHNLQAFRSVLAEISAVCDITTQEGRLEQNDKQVLKMQGSILKPLEQLLQAVAVVEGLEAELKTVEKNLPKIRTILSSIDDSNITPTEHLHNRQVILANVRSMRRTLEDIERCKGELHIPLGAEEGLQVHSRGRLLLQSLEELELLTRQQTSLLEDKIRAEEEASATLGITAVSHEMDRSLQRHLVQGAFEVFYSEEEEDEDDRSCHSSSSDTLTSSIPEDPEETLTLSDVQEEGMAEHKLLSDIKDLESLVPQSSSRDAEKPESDGNLGSKCVETGIITPDYKADFDKALSPGSVTAQSLNNATIPTAEGQFKAAVVDQHDSPKHEPFDADPRTKTPQAAAAVGDTRLIPSRPITPFTAGGTLDDLIDEEEDDPSLSTAPNPDAFNRLKEQTEVSTRCLLEGSQQPQQFPEEPISLAGHEDVNHEGQRWSRLRSKISEKLTSLKKVKEEHQSQICREDGGNGEKVPDELISPGSTCAVLQQIHESTTVLRQIVSSADGSHAGLKEEFYEAVRGVLLCLDSLTGLLLTRDSAGEDESHLRLLQQECVSAELGTLSQLMSKVESEIRPTLSTEEPDAYSCLTCLQDCLHTAQLALTSSHNQLIEDSGLKDPCQELSSNQLCLLDEFELGQSQIFPNLKDTPSLECVLGRHLRESPGEKAKLQHSSRALLQGITRLLELGEECTRERKMSQVQSRSKLQAVLCRNKKLLQVLRSQMAFVQYLFQHEPEALKCQEDERVQLEVRAKSLQQQALEQEVASQRRLQEWTRWEDNCGRLGRVLDEFEAFISRWEPEGDDDEEELVQHRLDACQKMLVQLDDNKAALGVILDQGKVLQAEPLFTASAHQAGGALELRWKSAYRLMEQEIQRCRNIQDARVRFQTNFGSVSEWLAGANDHLKTLSGLADTSDVNQECVQSSLIKLLDFSMEVEGMSLLKASVSKDAAQLLQLKEADCPGLRTQLTHLENSWNQLTSDMSKTQGQLQQCLLAAQPSAELLCDLEDWLKQMQSCMNQEKEKALKASNVAQVTKILQHFQAFKAAATNGQLLLDFLCQPGPQMADVQALRSERTVFAEKLGAFRLQWLYFQRELESQISGAEQIHSTCAERERRLQCLHVWIEQQRKQLNQWKQPTSQTLARKALLEREALQGGVKEVATALRELKTTRVYEKKEDEHPCAFSNEAEGVSHACRDLSQQIEALRPALQQVVEKWSCFHRDLRDVTLHTTRVRCAFQHQQAPLFSLKQAEGYVDFLQQLQEEAGKGEALWAALDKSCQSLVGSLHHGAAQALCDEVEGERKRWKNMVQEIKDENIKTGETLSLWQEYASLSDSCSAQLEHLLHEWEELSRSSLSPGQDTQGLVCSVKKLEDAAQELQSSMGDVLASSKPLLGWLEPLPANIIQSETRLLSRGILLLNKAVSGKKKSLQEDLEQLKLFHTQLEALEKQTQNLQHKLQAGIHDTDSVKQVLQELSESFPSLLDLREMSGYVSLNNQETERLHMLSREWVESMTRTSDRELQAECQHSLSFQEKSRRLTQIKEKLQQESVCRKNQSYASLQEMLTVHQRLQADITVGHQLLRGLLCDAVTSMEKETGEKRSELMAQVVCLKDGWFSSVGLACLNRTLTKEQLRQWRIYSSSLRRLWKLLRDVDSLLPPTGHFLCTLDQPQNCVNDYQCVTESLELHSTVYTQTLEAGRHLCETMTDSECQSRLQSELQAIEEAWERTTSLLRERRNLVHTTVKMSCQCQEGIISIVSELDKLKLKQQTSERPDDSALIQETELSLQRLNTGLRELATMKTDLSQYVAASDSALLEQQLEQLHSQWEELCMKVSSRKQEIADRLNAWTIFNDKNKEFCDWLTHMENKVCHCGDLSIKEMVEKLKKDCMEEINLFSENKSHLKQLGDQLLLASDEAKQTKVHESLQEVNQRWHNLFHQIEARVKKLKETLVTMQQLDKNMSNLRSWLSRIEAELWRPITYSVCHEQEIQRRLAEQQELQRDIEQHTEGVASVLSLCDVLLRDEDAAGGAVMESDSLQETSRSLDQRWRTICAMALDRRLRIEETWTLWCKFLDDYSRFEDWLKMAERTATNPNSADVLFAVAKEELKKFEGFQRQVHEQLTHLELVNNQYRRLARENRTDRASQLKAMIHEGNRRWDTLHRRVAAILRRLKHFTSQREEFEGTRESLVVWLTDLDLQLTNVEHFSESDVHHKIQQLNSFQREITLNTERIDGLIVFGEGLIQKSSPQDAENIEEELEELHSYCQEVFGRLVRFHQRLSQPPMITEEPELSGTTFSLESSLELIGRPWLGRSLGSLPATPTHLLSSPLERSGRETPDSLPLEWDHTVDVGGSSSHEEEEEEEGHEDEAAYFSALSEVELTENQEEFIEASEAPLASSLVSGRSIVVHETSRWPAPGDREPQFDTEGHTEAAPTLASTPLKPGYLRLMSQCSRSIESINRVSLILDDKEQPEEFGLTGLAASDKQSGVIERWELLQAQSRCSQQAGPEEPQQLRRDLDNITSWLENAIPQLDRLQKSDPAASIEEMEARAKELKEMQKMFTHYKSIMLSVNLRAGETPEAQEKLMSMNRDWSRACTGLQQWDTSLRKKLMQCQEFHESLHSLLLWLAHAESRRYAVDISHADTTLTALQQHSNTLTALQKELRDRQAHQASLQALWSQLQPEDGAEESDEAREKLHVTGSKLKMLLKQVDTDLSALQQRLDRESATAVQYQNVSQEAEHPKKGSSTQRKKRDSSPPRSFFYRALRAAFPLHLLLLLLLLLPCLIPMSEIDSSCTVTNNFARSFYPMLHYTNGPPPT